MLFHESEYMLRQAYNDMLVEEVQDSIREKVFNEWNACIQNIENNGSANNKKNVVIARKQLEKINPKNKDSVKDIKEIFDVVCDLDDILGNDGILQSFKKSTLTLFSNV